MVTQHIFRTPTYAHIFDAEGRNITIEHLLHGIDKEIWQRVVEIDQLAQGNKYGVTSKDTINFINQHKVPSTAKLTYTNFIADHKPLKSEPYRIHCVVGGDKLEFVADTGVLATHLVEFKLLANRIISDIKKDAKF